MLAERASASEFKTFPAPTRNPEHGHITSVRDTAKGSLEFVGHQPSSASVKNMITDILFCPPCVHRHMDLRIHMCI